jgi:hypothetical protein
MVGLKRHYSIVLSLKLLLSYLYGIFSTTIFDDSEEETGTGQEDHQMFWFCVVIAIFFLGVAISYYIIHH